MSTEKNNDGEECHTVRHCEKDTVTPTTPPLISSGVTAKQTEVLLLLQKGYNPTNISRQCGVGRNAVVDRLNSLVRKGLVIYENHTYSITIKAQNLLKTLQTPVTVGVTGPKTCHANIFQTSILRKPHSWSDDHIYFQSLKAHQFLHSKRNKQVFFYYDECNVRIDYGKQEKVTFFVHKQYAASLDEAKLQAWDIFVKYYNIILSNGFSLESTITSPDPELSNSQGFFATLASKLTVKGYRIETEHGSFWIDYSDGIAEEESSDEEVARRMEQLADSALKSTSDFQDLDKLKDIVGQLVVLETYRTKREFQGLPKLDIMAGRPDYFG